MSSHTQPPSSTSSVVGHELSDDFVSAPAAIDERVIAAQVLGVQRGHRKGVECIIKGRTKASDTSCSLVTTELSKQSTQATEEHRLLRERVDAQQRELDVLKAFITQMISQPQPLLPPPPPPSFDNADDLRRD